MALFAPKEAKVEGSELSTDVVVAICKAQGLNLACYPRNETQPWTVAGEAGHQEDYGPFFQKGVIGWGKTPFLAWLDYWRGKAQEVVSGV